MGLFLPGSLCKGEPLMEKGLFKYVSVGEWSSLSQISPLFPMKIWSLLTFIFSSLPLHRTTLDTLVTVKYEATKLYSDSLALRCP